MGLGGWCKHDKTVKALRSHLRRPEVRSVLELGSGPGSTPLIREYMEKNGGFCLSLESDEYWFNNPCIPNDEYGEIKYAPIVCSVKHGCWYGYELNCQFDLILIDGPDRLCEHDTKILEKHLKKYGTCLSDTSRGGAQSSTMLDYVYPTMHKNSVVIVDFRLWSVNHYKYKYSKKLKFVARGKHRAVTIIKNK